MFEANLVLANTFASDIALVQQCSKWHSHSAFISMLAHYWLVETVNASSCAAHSEAAGTMGALSGSSSSIACCSIAVAMLNCNLQPQDGLNTCRTHHPPPSLARRPHLVAAAALRALLAWAPASRHQRVSGKPPVAKLRINERQACGYSPAAATKLSRSAHAERSM